MKIVFNEKRQLVISSFGTTETMALDLWKESARQDGGFKADAFVFEAHIPAQGRFPSQSEVEKNKSASAGRGGDGAEKLLYCSFCGKSQHEIKKLIAGPGQYICDECIALCNDIIGEEIYRKEVE